MWLLLSTDAPEEPRLVLGYRGYRTMRDSGCAHPVVWRIRPDVQSAPQPYCVAGVVYHERMCHRSVTIAFGSVTFCVLIVTPPVADLCHDIQINWLYAHRVTDDFGPVTTCYEPDVMGQGVFNEGALFRFTTDTRQGPARGRCLHEMRKPAQWRALFFKLLTVFSA